MKLLTSIATLLLLVGCPTPPETVSGPAGGTNATPPPAPPGGKAPGAQEEADNLPLTAADAAGPPPSDGGTAGVGPVGGPESGMVIEIQGTETAGATPMTTQEELLAGEHILFTGKVSCDSYTGKLVLRITRAPSGGGDAGGDQNDYVTAANLDGPGDFALALPPSEDLLVLEVLADANGDGQPTIGERAAIYMLTGEMSPEKNRDDIVLALTL